MKGACRTIGAMALAEVCERIEMAGRKKHWQAITAERAALDREIERLNTWLAAETGTEIKGVASWE
jgi:HPt (histidine-containing phosphotransfer) domain-containing protein